MPIISSEEERVDSIRINSKDPVMMAMYMLQDNPSIVSCQETLYIYNGKCYDFLSDKMLDQMYIKFCIEYGITSAFKSVSLTIRALLVYPTIPVIEKMNDYQNLMCLNNGILNIITKEFIPHSEKYYFDSCINVDYDQDALSCPNFVSYLNHTFNDDQETIANIIRIGGYLLDTSCQAKTMFMFDGGGGSGKSTLIDTFSMFFVESMDYKNQVTSLSLEQIASGTFDKETLINSRFNQCAETKGGQIDAEEIKKIVSGDIISVSRKFKLAVNFRPKTKIIVACNGLPTFTDKSEGIYRRLMIINFENQYKKQSEYNHIKYPELKNIYVRDPELMDKIKEERSAILNLFIGGLIDLKNNRYEFVDSTASQKATDSFKKQSDSVREYLEDNFEVDDKNKISLQEIYDGFRTWYRKNVQDQGTIKLRSAEMAKRIKEAFSVGSCGREVAYNHETKSYEKLTMYNLKRINEPVSEEEYTNNQIEALL